MTVSELIAYVDSVKPNAFSDSDKLVWLNEIEARIQTEVMLRWQGEMEQYALPEDKDTELFSVRKSSINSLMPWKEIGKLGLGSHYGALPCKIYRTEN